MKHQIASIKHQTNPKSQAQMTETTSPRAFQQPPRLLLVPMLLACVCTAAGCRRPPAVEFENLHLISSLRTACSAQNEQWLDGVERAVKLRHEEGRMSDAEKVHFEKLIERARGGDWRGAEEQCFAFEKAQLGRTRTRPPPREHDHHHQHQHDDGLRLASGKDH